MYVLLHTARSPTLQQFYEIHWSVLPNLSMDIVVPVLATVFPLETSGKIFVALILLLISSGTIALHYAVHKRLSPWPYIVFLFLFNSMLILGVINYLFGLGLALWGIAIWILLREKSNLVRIPMFYVFAVVLFFAHFSAFGFYAVVVLAYEASRSIKAWYPTRALLVVDWAYTLGQFLIPALLFLHSRTAGRAELTTSWELFRKAVAPIALVWNYNFILDMATLIAICELIIIGLIARKLAIARSMKMALLVLALIFLVMPSTVLSSNYADYRLVPALTCLFIASSDFGTARRSNWRPLLIAGLAGLFVLRMGVVVSYWQNIDKQYAEYLQAIDKLPMGSRLFAAFGHTPEPNKSFDSDIHLNEESIPFYAVIRKSAFVPLLYADPTIQPISFTPAYQRLAEQTSTSYGGGGDSPAWEQLKNYYDYWLIVRESLFKLPLPDGIEPVFTGRDFRLYKVKSSGRTDATIAVDRLCSDPRPENNDQCRQR